MLDRKAIDEFLAQRRLAVVGVSQRPSHFGSAIFRELRAHGYDAVPVSRSLDRVDDQACYPTLADVPGALDGVVVMVGGNAALGVIEDAATAGVPRVWLFKGLAGKGAYSRQAVDACRAHGMQVVEGACPMMFLEPVASFHKVHRFFRRCNRSLPKSIPSEAARRVRSSNAPRWCEAVTEPEPARIGSARR